MSRRFASALTLLSLGAFVVVGCGDSKPEFCSKADDLKEAFSTLKSDVSSGNVSAIRSDAQTLRTDVDAAASSAKSDFPSQSKAVRSSVSTLSSTIDALPSKPSTSDLVGLAGDVTAVATAVDDFKAATKSKCD
jgi:hypothetical protein